MGEISPIYGNCTITYFDTFMIVYFYRNGFVYLPLYHIKIRIKHHDKYKSYDYTTNNFDNYFTFGIHIFAYLLHKF